MVYKTHTIIGRVRVNGHKLKISECPDFEFFSYRTDRGFFVCEKQTGLALAWGKKLKLAKKESIRRINTTTLEEFKRLVAIRLERYGYCN